MVAALVMGVMVMEVALPFPGQSRIWASNHLIDPKALGALR